ncbi:excalibur calcium-binding domain-containing protein [uncultured Lamprocystis sp.]|uniref:excalibur calcium-binding domain-containing protein n=1 Tax=uncultured Lamprocystis sp. TaxID=543132 RepID=UPI0025D19287|nr:excalibur calcium-binding domain-containing protein [uncultured Lamprocystis sp.]
MTRWTSWNGRSAATPSGGGFAAGLVRRLTRWRTIGFELSYTAFTSRYSGAAAEYATPTVSAAPRQTFRCDGRTRCSQMNSCAEALYFLRNCPNTQMDGDNDGEPCEQQWCN